MEAKENTIKIDDVLISQNLIDQIRSLQSNNNAGVNDVLEEMDDITCDLADMSLNDPDASQGKYLSIIQAIRGYRRIFESMQCNINYSAIIPLTKLHYS